MKIYYGLLHMLYHRKRNLLRRDRSRTNPLTILLNCGFGYAGFNTTLGTMEGWTNTVRVWKEYLHQGICAISLHI